MILLDVGVWLAAIWGGHQQHKVTAAWFNQQARDLLLCRVTQMAILRLLTIQGLMGPDVLTRADAWRTVDHLRTDVRVRWANEPAHLDQTWRALSAHNDHSHKLWTDDYLAAFAQAAGASIATLDKKFTNRYPSIDVEQIA